MAPVYKNFIYNEKHGFIFAYVPKVACTNWKSLLRYMAGHEDWLDNKLAHDKERGGLRYLDLETADAALLNNPTIKKYAMVRDPYSRILSAYLNKVENHLPVKPDGEHFDKVVRDIDAFRRNNLDNEKYPEISLEVFLLWLRDSGSWFIHDEHWAPQVTLLHQPGVKFDIMGRFESLTADSSRILKAMGCDKSFPSQKDVKFAPTDAKDKVDRYFTPACYRLVNQIYAQDFKYLSYNVYSEGEVKIKDRKPDELQSLKIIKDLGFPITTVIDVGVQFKTEALAQVFPGKTHILIGPVNEHMERLKKYYDAKGVDAKVAPVAAAEFDGEIKINVASVVSEQAGEGRDGARVVPARKIDTLVEEFGAKGPFLLKIDVDGAETRVLEGAKKTLEQAVIVIVEAQVRNFFERSKPLIEAGFELMDVVDLCYYNNRLSQFDLIFAKKKILVDRGLDLVSRRFDPNLWFKLNV